MLEYLLDFTNTYALYSIYVGLVLGLLLKLWFDWSVKETSIDLLARKIQVKLTTHDIMIQRKSRVLPNRLLIWMIKYIRNKTGTGDDSEATLISFQS
ncbi:hypothetical protein HHO41_06555 [Bacillus sp. DNRA2]|uniref:hypothetical protein n=1 Tax=Bacillus sp. DNRA2 TaxID=2723053 RepID=UPI00145CADD7|nr:hypothetical protein [Bacillus sp. DNRA2]NMD69944.1 hypothetical protein [Bacillus sp. DNRA2]